MHSLFRKGNTNSFHRSRLPLATAFLALVCGCDRTDTSQTYCPTAESIHVYRCSASADSVGSVCTAIAGPDSVAAGVTLYLTGRVENGAGELLEEYTRDGSCDSCIAWDVWSENAYMDPVVDKRSSNVSFVAYRAYDRVFAVCRLACQDSVPRDTAVFTILPGEAFRFTGILPLPVSSWPGGVEPDPLDSLPLTLGGSAGNFYAYMVNQTGAVVGAPSVSDFSVLPSGVCVIDTCVSELGCFAVYPVAVGVSVIRHDGVPLDSCTVVVR